MIIINDPVQTTTTTAQAAGGLADIISNLCELPTGVHALEFIPKHEITGWVNGVPSPRYRWYSIGPYRDSLTYAQPTEDTVQGMQTPVSVGCLVVNDTQAVADLLQEMGNMQFVLRVAHYQGKKRIVGTPTEFCKLASTDFNPTEIVGAQGYKLNFTGTFSRRPIVVA